MIICMEATIYIQTINKNDSKKKGRKTMYNITKDEALSLLQNLRQIRQKSGEMIAFLEHMMQLQDQTPLRELSYNPDDYLEERGRDGFDGVGRSFCGDGCRESVNPICKSSDFETGAESEVLENEGEAKNDEHD